MPLSCEQQDLSEQARLHHLELLPKAVQHQLMTKWRPGENRHKDVEDILKVYQCQAKINIGNT